MWKFGKAALILVPLAIVGMRLHARANRTPAEVTGEVNRAISLVRVAASKRGSGAPASQPPRSAAHSRRSAERRDTLI